MLFALHDSIVFVPETNQNHPAEGWLGREGLKSHKENTDLNWDFQREGVGEGSQTEKCSVGGVWIFLLVFNIVKIQQH